VSLGGGDGRGKRKPGTAGATRAGKRKTPRQRATVPVAVSAATGATPADDPATTAPVAADVEEVTPPADPPPPAAAEAPAGTAPAEPPTEPPAIAPELKQRDPLWARALIVFGVVLVLASGGLLGGTLFVTHRYDNSVKKANLLADDARAVAVPDKENGADTPVRQLIGPLNFLLLGSDARDGSPEAGQRSDTIIIAHVPASMDHVYLISIPRDLRVQIPADPTVDFHGSHEKINGAFEYGGGGAGGVRLMSSTLTQLTGIRFDGAAVVDFSGFKSVVKELDGITLCVDQRTVSDHIGFDSQGHYLNPHDGGNPMVYEPGCRVFADWEALDYVRQRKSLPDGDYGRQRHEQQFLQALLVRAREKGIASNPIKLDQFIRAVAGTLTVDTNGMSLTDLAFGLRSIRSTALTGITVPSEPQWIGDISYVVALEQSEGLFQAMRDDTLEAWADANPNWVNNLS